MESMVGDHKIEDFKGKRVFVTGHTGFKGSWLVRLLNHLGAEVCGYSLAPQTEPNHFDIIQFNAKSTIGDIIHSENLHKSLNDFQPEIVFHLAAQALVRKSYTNPKNTYETNVIGTLNILEAVRFCSSVKAVVLVTTDKVYENKEWEFPYRENDELGGHDLYSSSKACCEILVKSYRNSFLNRNDYKSKHNVLIASARAGNVIGGADWSEYRLIPDIVRATTVGQKTFIRNPLSIRPWQHVLDCLNGYLLLALGLLEGKIEFSEAWNFSPNSSESKTVEDIVNHSKLLWPEINIEFGDSTGSYHEAGRLKLDNSKASAKLNWKPKWNTEMAIERTINWYRDFYQKGQINTNKDIVDFLASN